MAQCIQMYSFKQKFETGEKLQIDLKTEKFIKKRLEIKIARFYWLTTAAQNSARGGGGGGE